MTELLDESAALLWLERPLHPDGLHCPRGRSTASRLVRAQGHCSAYRCRACDGSYTLRTGTVFAKTRPRPATLVLLRRGMAQGAPTARLARALGLSRQQLPTRRRRIQARLHATAPTGARPGPAFEADALSQNAGQQKPPASRPHRSAPPARPSAQRPRHLGP